MTAEEPQQYRVVGVVQVWKRIDIVVEAADAASAQQEALDGAADELSVAGTDCAWWEEHTVLLLPVEEAGRDRLYHQRYRATGPCNRCGHRAPPPVAGCDCGCHEVSWPS